jgi:agmatine/peptidylarginine deiminase
VNIKVKKVTQMCIKFKVGTLFLMMVCAVSIIFGANEKLSDSEMAIRDSIWYSKHPGQLPIWETLKERQLREAKTQSQKGVLDNYTTPPPARVRSIAEFEPVEGVLISYSGQFGLTTATIREFAKETKVYCIVSSANEFRAKSELQNGGVDMNNVNLILTGVDSYWTRDYGPWWIADSSGKVSMINFKYNRPRSQDDATSKFIANLWNVDSYYMPLSHCGGNFMCDGKKVGASTDLVIEENSSLGEKKIDSIAERFLGISTYHKTIDPLGDYIKHIDCWGKFLGPDKILIGKKSGSQNAKYDSVANYYSKKISAWGTPYKVYRVFTNGEPYTNSIILNKKVFVPIQNTSNDSAALNVYKKAMPGYSIIGVTGSWESTDAVHCRANGIADRKMLYVSHMPYHDTMKISSEIVISAEIIPYSKSALIDDSVNVHYSYSQSGPFKSVKLIKTEQGKSSYTAKIPSPEKDTTVYYYIQAVDSLGKRGMQPYSGVADPHMVYIKIDRSEVPFVKTNPKASGIQVSVSKHGQLFTLHYYIQNKQSNASFSVYTSNGKMLEKKLIEKNQGFFSVKNSQANNIVICRIENGDQVITKNVINIK